MNKKAHRSRYGWTTSYWWIWKYEFVNKCSYIENLLEIRQYLQEQTKLMFFENFSIYHHDKKLSDYSEIKTVTSESNAKFFIKLDPYTEKTAKFHFSKVL